MKTATEILAPSTAPATVISCSPATAATDTYDPDNVFLLNHNIAPSGR
jgi:hypothetical protein